MPYAAQDLTRMPARDLLTLPLLLEDEREVAEESVWKVIAPKGVVVLVQPEDEAAALGRLRGMQMVEVELAVGPWLKLKKTAGWVRAQGGTRGAPAALTPAPHAGAARDAGDGGSRREERRAEEGRMGVAGVLHLYHKRLPGRRPEGSAEDRVWRMGYGGSRAGGRGGRRGDWWWWCGRGPGARVGPAGWMRE